MKHALLSAVICLLICLPVFPQKSQTRLSSKSSRRQTLASKPRTVSRGDEDTASKSLLPIRRVILYSNGVAYIERRGLIMNHAEVSLSFKQSQVDDVLKSMVVLDLGQGRIGAVSYNSSPPVASRMAEIPFTISAASDGNNGGGLAGVLSQLQGAHVIVTTANKTVTGSILTVEARRSQIDASKPPFTSHQLVIASDSGEVSGVDLSEVRSLRLVDEGARRDLSEFAHAAAAARRRDAKTIVVTSDGVGQRELVVSYTISAPIWKTTYRVVLDDKGKPFFQGWAIVDNISEEDWEGIQLSLVSGTPVSFIQQIQNPVYRYRPIVPLQNDLNIKPQTYEPGEGSVSGAGSLRGEISDANGAAIVSARVVITNATTNRSFEVTTNDEGEYSVSELPPGNYAMKVTATGFNPTLVNNLNVSSGLQTNFDVKLEVGSVSETVTVNAQDATMANNFTPRAIQSLPLNGRFPQSLFSLSPGVTGAHTPIANLVASGRSGVETQTSGSEVGDLFEYRIEQPVTVPRDRSALIPILQTRMEGERVSIFNEQSPSNRPMSGMLLKNTSSLTLDDGSLTVIDGDAYAGEALMARLKPGEERLVAFALDLGTLVNVISEESQRPTYMLKVRDGVAFAYHYDLRKKRYTVINQTEQPRVIYIEHPISAESEWELAKDSAKPDLKTAKHYRFRVTVGPHQKVDLPVIERRENYDSFTLADFTRAQLDLFISRKYIDDQTREQLEKLIELKSQIARLEAQLQDAKRQAAEITQDQQRLRENIKTLTETPEAKQLITRYVTKANDQETRLEEIDKQREVLSQQKLNLQTELSSMIRGFALDRRIE